MSLSPHKFQVRTCYSRQQEHYRSRQMYIKKNPWRYSSDEPWPAEQPPLAVFPDYTRRYWVDMWSAHRIPQHKCTLLCHIRHYHKLSSSHFTLQTFSFYHVSSPCGIPHDVSCQFQLMVLETTLKR
jgi:hypothetical protein